MTINWADAFLLMLLGMGTVFVFLLVLVVSMRCLSLITHYFFPESFLEVDASGDGEPHEEIVAAVAAAHYLHHQHQHPNEVIAAIAAAHYHHQIKNR